MRRCPRRGGVDPSPEDLKPSDDGRERRRVRKREERLSSRKTKSRSQNPDCSRFERMRGAGEGLH